MSGEVWVGLALQAAAVAVLVGTLRRNVFSRVGAIFILFAVVFHGVGEILVRLSPDQNPYRRYLYPWYVDDFVLNISLAILLLTMAYLAALGPRAARYVRPTAERQEAMRFFDWRIMAILTIPFVLITARGAGATIAASGHGAPSTLNTAGSFNATLLLLVLPLAGLAFINRFGPRWILPVLLAVALIASLSGQRSDVLVAIIILLFGLSAFSQYHPTKRVAAGMVVVLLGASIVLTSSRAAVGREAFGGGQTAGSRVSALIAGVQNIGSSSTASDLSYTLAYRLDGNSFGALELQAIDGGAPPLGMSNLETAAYVAVPSFLNPNKIFSSVTQRSTKTQAEQQFNISLGDIIPTQLGSTVGWYGAIGLLVISMLIGALLALLDRWIARRISPVRLIIALAAVQAFAQYEKGVETWTIAARSTVVLAVLLAVGTAALKWWRERQPSELTRSVVAGGQTR